MFIYQYIMQAIYIIYLIWQWLEKGILILILMYVFAHTSRVMIMLIEWLLKKLKFANVCPKIIKYEYFLPTWGCGSR